MLAPATRRRSHPDTGLTPSGVDDRGFTLIELLVAMLVFSIVMAIVFAAINGWVVNSETRITKTGQASAAVQQAFMQLDGEVRYASFINAPSSASGNYLVTFESDWTAASQGYNQCTEVEYDGTAGTLQQRVWLLTTPGATPPTGWQVLASGLTTGITTSPFTLSKVQPSLVNPDMGSTTTTSSTSSTTLAPQAPTPWQLTVSLASTVGVNPQSGTAQTSFTMTAIDVTIDSAEQTQVCGGNPT